MSESTEQLVQEGDDTIIFVPINKSDANEKEKKSKEYQRRFRQIKTAESENFLTMLRTEKKDPKFSKSRSSIVLVSNKEQTVVRNGAKPEGFSPKEFKVSCGTLSALINHLTSDCGK